MGTAENERIIVRSITSFPSLPSFPSVQKSCGRIGLDLERRARETEFRESAFPNGVWEREGNVGLGTRVPRRAGNSGGNNYRKTVA